MARRLLWVGLNLPDGSEPLRPPPPGPGNEHGGDMMRLLLGVVIGLVLGILLLDVLARPRRGCGE